MQTIIANQISKCNNYFNQSAVCTPEPDMVFQSDLMDQLLNLQIAKNIESYIRTLKGLEREIFLYLFYYFRKWGGNIELPIKNICERFKIKRSWCMELVKRLYDRGMLVTIKGGYGQKVTRRTFTERAQMVYKAISQGVKVVKQVIHKNTGHYSGHYPGDSLINISSKVDRSQSKPVSLEEQEGEIPQERQDFAKQEMAKMKKMINLRV